MYTCVQVQVIKKSLIIKRNRVGEISVARVHVSCQRVRASFLIKKINIHFILKVPDYNKLILKNEKFKFNSYYIKSVIY